MMRKPTTCLIAMVIAVATLGVVKPVAAAPYYRDTSAGGACHAALGASEPSFKYSNNYLTNAGTTDQYVVCHFAMNDLDNGVTPISKPTYLAIEAAAGSTTGTLVCVAQYGYFTNGITTLRSSNARSVTIGAGGNNGIIWDTSLLNRLAYYETLTLNCKVPAGFKLGLIQFAEGSV